MQKRFSISNVLCHLVTLATLSMAGCSNLDSEDDSSTAQAQADTPPVASNQQSPTLEIVEQPQSISVTTGDQAEFSVVANGENLSYQWQKEASVIIGATDSRYVIPQTSVADEGTYSVRVYDENNRSVMSLFAQLHVNEAPSPIVISQQPQSISATEGDSISLSVTASGGGFLTYQWQHDGENVELANGPSLILTDVQLADAGNYQVVIGNSTSSVISNTAELSISISELPLRITQQPSSLSVNAGESTRFEVIAQGGVNLSYQWHRNGTAIDGATSPTLELNNVSSNDTGLYSVSITSPTQSVQSLDALLDVTEYGTAKLRWSIPAQREDESALTHADISGYVIMYGKSSTTLDEQLLINGATQTSATIQNLEAGAWYFRIATQDTEGRMSEYSEVAILNIEAN